MRFLVANMPQRDLRTLAAAFLLENVDLACRARKASPWKYGVPYDIFLNDVLPYASINEARDPWPKSSTSDSAPWSRTPRRRARLPQS